LSQIKYNSIDKKKENKSIYEDLVPSFPNLLNRERIIIIFPYIMNIRKKLKFKIEDKINGDLECIGFCLTWNSAI